MDPKLIAILRQYGLSEDEAARFAGGLNKVEEADPMRKAMRDMISATAQYHALSGAVPSQANANLVDRRDRIMNQDSARRNANPYDQMVKQYSEGPAIPATPASGEVPDFSTLNINSPTNNPQVSARLLSDSVSSQRNLARLTNSPGGDSFYQGQLDRMTHPYWTSLDSNTDLASRQYRRRKILDATDQVKATGATAIDALRALADYQQGASGAGPAAAEIQMPAYNSPRVEEINQFYNPGGEIQMPEDNSPRNADIDKFYGQFYRRK